ncbi:MAG: hypothetical protein IT450_08255 [Phycisphaerales bacterium]|nr:hypothetical protein [Phycisphaerales bacterium]
MEAFGINDLDQVCGYMATSSPPYRNYGFIWDRETGEYTTIEAPTWATRIEAEDINNAGVVVGTLFSSREVRAFRWQNGVFYDLAADLGVVSSHAYDVNERGEIVGEGGSGADQYGYLSSSQGITWLPRPAEFSSCEAEALNHTGFSVGLGAIGFPGDPQYAGRGLIWLPNGIQIILAPPLGNRDVLMEGINDAGRAVGITSRRLFGGPLTYAFVWQSDTLTDLNALTVDAPRQLADAHAINAAGQILVTRGVLTSVWLPGDLTGDCHVSIDDLVLVLTNFGLPRGSFPRGDVNLDGEVGLADLAVVFAHWGE